MASTAEWLIPSSRSELIENLVSGVGKFRPGSRQIIPSQKTFLDRYNPSNVGILEDYLYHQIRSEEYDCLANLAILKL